MRPLPDPRHEAFARYLAFGHDSHAAYVHAGYSVKNIKTRSQALSKNPHIRARTAYLKKCLPDILDLQERHAPSLLLRPETQDQMLAWLWQVMNGTRQILPIQLRAATLFCRMKGWHLTKPQPTPQQQSTPTSQLSHLEKTVLADFSKTVLSRDLHGQLMDEEEIAQFHTLMATLRACATSEGNPAPRPGWRDTPADLPQSQPEPKFEPAPTTPDHNQPQTPAGDPEESPEAHPLATHLEAQLTTLETEITSLLSPLKSPDGESAKVPQPIEHQPLRPKNPQLGRKWITTPHRKAI